MLVAYSFFGDCNTELANTGPQSLRARPVTAVLLIACRRLMHASTLFEHAMARRSPLALVAAGRASLTAEPLLAQARLRLQALH